MIHHPAPSRPLGGLFRGTPQAHSPAILLVDDNPEVLAALSATLRITGYQVVSCQGPFTALEIAKRKEFDLLVSDFDMPEMNGFALASALTLACPALRVILISGMDPKDLPQTKIVERGWDLNFKPIDAGRLIGSIESQLHGRRRRAKDSLAAGAGTLQERAT